ncbi:MAG TPA: restriction endonuclease subunit S, partial [Blastocatellia bacterium]|nr:restriction endonuclease subunit S [Blastocatellia bacterium]
MIRSNGNRELVGRSMYFRGSERPIAFSGFCIRFRPDRRLVDPIFAAYLIRSPFFRQRFSAFGSGTGIQNLSQGLLSAVPVLLPPIIEQKEIARTLSALDRKIELNRKMNATLERIAQTL